MKTIFDLCQPRQDVLGAAMRDEDFAADPPKVVVGNATDEYKHPTVFFRYTRRVLASLRLLLTAS